MSNDDTKDLLATIYHASSEIRRLRVVLREALTSYFKMTKEAE